MTPSSSAQGPVIDLAGLPETTIATIRSIVEAARQQASALPPGDWEQLFDAYLREVAARAGRYPEGFVLDDSRDTIYEGRGE